MKATSYLTLLYGIAVLLVSIMGFKHTGNRFFIIEEICLGILLIFSAIYMIKEKKFSYFLSLFICLILFISYSYLFATTTNFFPGLMAAITVFIGILQVIKIFHLE